MWRTLNSDLRRDITLVCLAAAVVGLSYGAIAVGSGFSIWLPVAMSLLVFAGAAQFLFVGIIAAGGSPVAAMIAGLLVNTRHLPFGMAISDILGPGSWRRAVGSHVMTDESVAFALSQDNYEHKRAAYWVCGAGIFVFWNTGVLIGAAAGAAIDDTDAFGLDAAFPAVLLALALPSLREPKTRRAALIGAAVALAVTSFLPAGLPVLLALAGLLALTRERATR